ncbi:MAG TPA: alpha/beta fold hydrolase [Thermoleophilaceae bacterium]
MSPRPEDAWLHRPEPQPDPPMRLICLPFAGGMAQSFHPWAGPLSTVAELCAVALPGRGTRVQEPSIDRIDRLTTFVSAAVRGLLDRPYALFGHSMGALLAYELARELDRAGAPAPLRLFVSGFRAPHLPARGDPLHVLPDDELTARLDEFGGTPPKVMESNAFMGLFLPPTRADLAACETYEHVPGPALATPITAFGGRADRLVSEDELRAWEQHTSGAFMLRLFEGGHFYLRDREAEFVEVLGCSLEDELVR